MADLQAKMPASDDPDAIYEAMSAANDAAMPLTQAQMDEVLKKTAVGKKIEGVLKTNNLPQRHRGHRGRNDKGQMTNVKVRRG